MYKNPFKTIFFINFIFLFKMTCQISHSLFTLILLKIYNFSYAIQLEYVAYTHDSYLSE